MMKIKATLVLLVWIAPLVTPLLPAHSACDANCCVAVEDLCHQESSHQDCPAMTEGIAGHPIPIARAPVPKSSGGPASGFSTIANAHLGHEFAGTIPVEPALSNLAPRFLPLII